LKVSSREARAPKIIGQPTVKAMTTAQRPAVAFSAVSNAV